MRLNEHLETNNYSECCLIHDGIPHIVANDYIKDIKENDCYLLSNFPKYIDSDKQISDNYT